MSQSNLLGFFVNGGSFAVLRPFYPSPDGTVSFDERRVLRSVRTQALKPMSFRAPLAGHTPMLVVLAPNDPGARVTASARDWPRPVLVPELNPPSLDTAEGRLLREGREYLRNISLYECLSHPVVGPILTQWARTASAAITRLLWVRQIYPGRVIVCVGDPFVGALASFLLPNESESGGPIAEHVLRQPVEHGYGFFVSLTPGGVMEIQALTLTGWMPRTNVVHLRRR